MSLRVVNLKDYPRETPNLRYIGRGSSLGNPFTHLPLAQTKAYVQCDTVESAVGCFEAWLRGSPAWDGIIPEHTRTKALIALSWLRGNELLGCYCQDLSRCHGQVIVKVRGERRGVSSAP